MATNLEPHRERACGPHRQQLRALKATAAPQIARPVAGLDQMSEHAIKFTIAAEGRHYELLPPEAARIVRGSGRISAALMLRATFDSSDSPAVLHLLDALVALLSAGRRKRDEESGRNTGLAARRRAPFPPLSVTMLGPRHREGKSAAI